MELFSFSADLIEEISSHELEDEESSPVTVIEQHQQSASHSANSTQSQKPRARQHSFSDNLDEDDYTNRNVAGAAPVRPAGMASSPYKDATLDGSSNGTGNGTGGESEGDVIGNIDQFVMQPAPQECSTSAALRGTGRAWTAACFPSTTCIWNVTTARRYFCWEVGY